LGTAYDREIFFATQPNMQRCQKKKEEEEEVIWKTC
jgi:hypothetical protein